MAFWLTDASCNTSGFTTLHGADPTRLRRWVDALAIPRHFAAESANNGWVQAEVAAALAGEGLAISLQGPWRNVVALPRERDAAPLTLIAAHYDSVPRSPGADDNASGVAVMLECARLLRDAQPGARVGFIAFNREEDGLVGSRDFVANGLHALGAPIDTVHVLEMVGFRRDAPIQNWPLPWTPAKLRRPDFIGLVTKGKANRVAPAAARAVAPGLRLIAARTWGPLHRLLPDITRSDHFPFWNAGIAAALWTDTGNFRNPHYHRRTDTPDTLDYDFMASITDLLCRLITRRSLALDAP